MSGLTRQAAHSTRVNEPHVHGPVHFTAPSSRNVSRGVVQHQPQRSRTRRTRARTSAHWWEDEEEFDAVGGEVLLPKTLHILALPSPSSDSLTAQAVQLLLENQVTQLTAGFCSPQCAETAQAVWQGLGAGGPPYFKKMRNREQLAGATEQASDQLLAELLGQNWRVELDYGLQGKELAPREHILLVVAHGHEVQTLLVELQPGETHEFNNEVALVQVEVRGWNTPDAPGGGHQPLGEWRNLLPVTMHATVHCSTPT